MRSQVAKGTKEYIRKIMRSVFQARLYVSKSLHPPYEFMSVTLVTPRSTACFAAASKYWSNCSLVGGVMAFITKVIAASFTTPVGSPSLFLTITPPKGATVCLSIPANFKALELAKAIWLSYLEINKGWSPVTESIHSFEGNSPPQFS